MEITLRILADELSEHYPNITVSSRRGQNLTGVALLGGKNVPGGISELCCCRTSGLPAELPEGRSFALVGVPSAPVPADEYLLIPDDSVDVQEVFMHLQHILLRLWRWYAEALEISARGGAFQALVDTSAPLFPGGVSLLSIRHNRLFCSDGRPAGRESRWERIFRAYSDPELPTLDPLPGREPDAHAWQGPRFVRLNPEESYLICNVFCDGVREGCFVAPLRPEESKSCHLLYMTELMHRAAHMFRELGQEAEDPLTRALHQMLRGEHLDGGELQERCRAEGWAAQGHTLRVLVIRPGEQERATFHREQLLYQKVVASIYYKSKALLFGGDIVLVRDFTSYHEFTEGEDSLDRLNCFLRRIRASMGASIPFSDLSQLRLFYEQAKTVAMAAGSGSATAHEYSNYLPYDMIRNFAATHSLHQYIHPEIRRLAELESRGSADLLLSLYYYLLNDRSYQHCAEKQHIHRSSFAYRIGKVLDTLRCDLNDENTRLSLLLSICMHWYLNPEKDPTGISRWGRL